MTYTVDWRPFDPEDRATWPEDGRAVWAFWPDSTVAVEGAYFSLADDYGASFEVTEDSGWYQSGAVTSRTRRPIGRRIRHPPRPTPSSHDPTPPPEVMPATRASRNFRGR